MKKIYQAYTMMMMIYACSINNQKGKWRYLFRCVWESFIFFRVYPIENEWYRCFTCTSIHNLKEKKKETSNNNPGFQYSFSEFIFLFWIMCSWACVPFIHIHICHYNIASDAAVHLQQNSIYRQKSLPVEELVLYTVSWKCYEHI